MKFNEEQMAYLRVMIGQGRYVSVLARNQYGQNAVLNAKVYSVDENGVILDFNSERENAHYLNTENHVSCYTDLISSGRFIKHYSLQDGFLIDGVFDGETQIFLNDQKTVARANRIYEQNYARDLKYLSFMNQNLYAEITKHIGGRVCVRSKFSANVVDKRNGILKSVRKANGEIILDFTSVLGERTYIVPSSARGIMFFDKYHNVEHEFLNYRLPKSESVKEALNLIVKPIDEEHFDLLDGGRDIMRHLLGTALQEMLSDDQIVVIDKKNENNAINTFFKLYPNFVRYKECINNNFNKIVISENGVVLDGKKVVSASQQKPQTFSIEEDEVQFDVNNSEQGK